MLQNPSNLYSAGNVVLDSNPYMRVALQQRARKQASDDALYKYYSELPSKINSAGMRTIDQDGLNKRLQNIGDFFRTNSKDVEKGGKAKQQLDSMYRDASQYVQQSKDTGKFILQTGKDYFQGKHRPRQRDLQIMDALDKSIDDPSHYKDPDIKMPYGFNDFSIAAKPFDSNAQISFDKSLVGKTEPVVDESTPPKYNADTYEVTYNKKFKPEHVYAIAQKAASDIKGNPSAYNFFEDALDNPDDVKRALDALSKLSGVDLSKVPDLEVTPEMMAAGLKADQFINFSKPETKKDVAAINKWKEQQAALAEANKRERQRRGEAGKNARLDKMMGDVNVEYPLNEIVAKYGNDTPIVSAEGNQYPINSIRIKVTDIPTGELNMYNKPNPRYPSQREVQPFIDPATKEEYYNKVKNKDGNWELEGSNGIIGADYAREVKINKTIPANKEKRKMLLNKPSAKKVTDPNLLKLLNK